MWFFGGRVVLFFIFFLGFCGLEVTVCFDFYFFKFNYLGGVVEFSIYISCRVTLHKHIPNRLVILKNPEIYIKNTTFQKVLLF